MTDNIWKYIKVAFITIFYFLFSSIIVNLLKIIGINITELSNNNKTIILLFADFLLVIILYLINRKDINKNIKNYIKNFSSYFTFGFKYWTIGILIMICSNIIINFFYPGGATNENIIQFFIGNYPIYMFVSAVIFTPFIEEIIFRKNIREIFNNDILYIIFSGFLFGLVHAISGNTIDQLLYIIPYGVLGSIFAYMYTKTNNILVPITFHFIHNFIVVMISIITIFGG